MFSPNVVHHNATVTRARREAQNGHRAALLWFTGLSGSGKSTLAHSVEEQLHRRGCRTIVLDGDNVRHGLCGDLLFTPEDRRENIRRIGEMTKLFVQAGLIVLTAFISPFQADRERVRKVVGPEDYIEIFCDASMDVCEARDVKGLYKKAKSGLIQEFTGVSSPYEMPQNPDLTVSTGTKPLDSCVAAVLELIVARGIFPR